MTEIPCTPKAEHMPFSLLGAIVSPNDIPTVNPNPKPNPKLYVPYCKRGSTSSVAKLRRTATPAGQASMNFCCWWNS